MEMRNELEELIRLLNAKQYTNLRQLLAEMNEADIAVLMEEDRKSTRLNSSHS